MKQPVKLVVIIPVGPLGSSYKFTDIVDTVNSVVHYATPDRRIIIVDSFSPLHFADRLHEIFPELIVLRMPQNYGYFGGLYKAESIALMHAHATFDFQVAVKMDSDALMIGKGLEDDAIRYFAEHPNVGMLGNYLNTGEGVDWPREQLLKQIGVVGWLRDSERAAILRNLVSKAQGHGYTLGEHVIGGVSMLNPVLVGKLVRQDLLLNEALRRCKLGEDHIFGLLCKAVGMDLGQFGSDEFPMAVSWRGLPASPEELVGKGKKIVHSTRFWEDMTEDQIRDFFRSRRQETDALPSVERVHEQFDLQL